MKLRVRKKWVAFGGSLILVTLVVIVDRIIVSQVNQPVSGVVKAGQPSYYNTYSINLTPKLQSDAYASFNYPKGLILQPPESSSSLQTYNYKAQDIEAWLLNISISNLPGGDLSNNSSFVLRKENPQTYSEATTIINSQSVIVMTNTSDSGFSKVAFLTHGGLVATVALKGDDSNGAQPLATAFNMVLSSWHWR
jgi:hypothetical protein